MNQLLFGLRVMASVVATLVARVRHGPARPTWPFLFEAVVRVVRRMGVRIGALPLIEQRAAWAATAPPNTLRPKVRIDAAAGAPVPSRWVVPHGVGDEAPVLVFFHGGAYQFGSFESHAELASGLAIQSGARLLFPDYRLAPEHRFPAGVDDVVATTRWVLATTPPARVVLAGDSAGGALSLAVLLALRDAGEPLPAGAVLMCPWVDLAARGGSLVANATWDILRPGHLIDWAQTYADEVQWKEPLVSPSHADLKGLPPLLIQLGSAELLFDQGVAFADKARAAGVDVRLKVEPDMIHAWQVLPQVSPVARRSIVEAGAFVKDLTARG